MPTYQYACTECDNSFEQFQSFSDDALTVCPQCAGRLRKVFNAVGVVFKGSGFYRTDSRPASADDKPAVKTGEAASGGDSSGSPATPEKKKKAGSKSESSSTKTAESAGSANAA